jgi:hypothetical protein
LHSRRLSGSTPPDKCIVEGFAVCPILEISFTQARSVTDRNNR